MTNPSTLAEKLQAEATTQPFLCEPAAFFHCQTCKTATSLYGKDPVTDRPVLITVTCKRWGCGPCARAKVRRLAFLTHNANPNRLLTLTVAPSLYHSAREAFEATSIRVPELCRRIRQQRGECEYLRVTEVTRAGFPHYHLLVRSAFIPQQQIKAWWNELTGATIVDVRKVSNDFKCYQYLVKYLTKLHRIEWTERHVSYSRNFFNPADLEKMVWPKMEHFEKSQTHPFVWLTEHYPGEMIREIRPGVYELPREVLEKLREVQPQEVGLPADAITAYTPDPTDPYIPGMEDVHKHDSF